MRVIERMETQRKAMPDRKRLANKPTERSLTTAVEGSIKKMQTIELMEKLKEHHATRPDLLAQTLHERVMQKKQTPFAHLVVPVLGLVSQHHSPEVRIQLIKTLEELRKRNPIQASLIDTTLGEQLQGNNHQNVRKAVIEYAGRHEVDQQLLTRVKEIAESGILGIIGKDSLKEHAQQVLKTKTH